MEQPDDHSPTPVRPPDPPGGAPAPVPGAPAEPIAPVLPDPPDVPVTFDAPDDLATVRDLILLAYPDVVPELVRGGTIAELRAAVAPAQAAYRHVADRIASTPVAPVVVTPPPVPAGAAGGTAPLDGLPPAELIRRALQRRG